MKRNYNLDLIRIAACVAVLVLHIFGVEGGYINTILYYLGTFGIPLFFMISGCNMLAKKRSYHEILLKVVNIYLFLIILCIIYGSIYALLKKKNISVIFDIFIDIFSNKSNLGILWFMVALSIIYLITPILYNFRNNRKLVLSLVVISSLIFISNIFLKKYSDVIIKDIVVQPLRLWTWITYYLLGYNIRNNNILSRKNSPISLVIITLIAVNYEYFIGKYIFGNLYAESFYDSLIIKIWIILLWNYVMHISIDKKLFSKITILSKATFCVYILQVILFSIIHNVIKMRTNVFINCSTFVLSTIILFIISILIGKTKILNRYFSLKIIGEKK